MTLNREQLLRISRALLAYLPPVGLIAAALWLLDFEAEVSLPWDQWPLLLPATLLLVGFFALKAVCWWLCLRDNGLPVPLRDAFETFFRALLTKYIPGKVWMVIGPAEIVARRHGLPLRSASMVSLASLMLAVLGGLCWGAPALAWRAGFGAAVTGGLLVAASGVFCLLGRRLPRLKLPHWLTRIPLMERFAGVRLSWPLIALSLLQWPVIGLAFACFYASGLGAVPWASMLWQPLANGIGIVVPLSPGGLGVREAVATWFLAEQTATVDKAVALTLAARLWFFMTEVVIFAVGYLMRWTRRNGDAGGNPVSDR